MRKFILGLVLCGLFISGAVIAQDEPAEITPPDPSQYVWADFLVDEFDNPVYITNAGDGTNRLFVMEQTGYIFVVENGEILPQPFLDVSIFLTSDVFQGGYTERGLLGLVFHPEYEENGIFFIHYINQDGDVILARYNVMADNPNVADASSAVTLLQMEDPFDNHNGGQLAFGPDGYLYVGIGDGGDLGDPLLYAQNPSVLFGKILRIDVNTGDETYTVPEDNPFVDDDAYQPEIWALGLRNPWRFSFDRATGDLYIGDVGEASWEEVDFQPADFPGGANYGWNSFEANYPFNVDVPVPAGMILPIAEYSHEEGCAVTAGYVYRGEALPDLQGVFFYGDYCSGKIWTTYQDADGNWQTEIFAELGVQVSSFGEDEVGELYLVDYKGSIFRLEAAE